MGRIRDIAVTTKAYALLDGFGLDRLSVMEWPPDPLPHGHVRIAVEAVSLNRRDLLLVEGTYAPRLRMPAIPGCDAAGHVIEKGTGCIRFSVGDRVVAHMFPDWLAGPPSSESLRSGLGGPVLQGTLRTEMVLPESDLLAVPEHLDMLQAATLPCAALTAWSAIAKFGGVRPGRTVLVQGTGGVSIFALQFAKLLGATVVATSSTPEKLARLLELGADAVFNYRHDPNWAERARSHVGGGFDLIVEVAGGDNLDNTVRMAKVGGMVAVIGVLAGNKAQVSLPLVLMRQIALQGVTCGSLADFRDMLAAIAAAKLSPVVSNVFAFSHAREAFAAMRDGRHFGKIVIDVAAG
jgi:NADPH:quinone reductase-like Zn-dependent oxidoreductase